MPFAGSLLSGEKVNLALERFREPCHNSLIAFLHTHQTVSPAVLPISGLHQEFSKSVPDARGQTASSSALWVPMLQLSKAVLRTSGTANSSVPCRSSNHNFKTALVCFSRNPTEGRVCPFLQGWQNITSDRQVFRATPSHFFLTLPHGGPRVHFAA